MLRITVKVDGMMCGMCEAHVNDTVRRSLPVQKVTSNQKKRHNGHPRPAGYSRQPHRGGHSGQRLHPHGYHPRGRESPRSESPVQKVSPALISISPREEICHKFL